MFNGLMDHWVPSHDHISAFWRTPFAELRGPMTDICDALAINNLTFYTKWYSNGLHSKLPFLINNPRAQNTLTTNGWGREWLDFFHARGMTVGAMLQCYTFEQGAQQSCRRLGVWRGTERATGTAPVDIVDPRWPEYEQWLRAMLVEHLTVYPDWDQIFLEFEGLGAAPADNDLLGDRAAAPFAPDAMAMWEALGRDPAAMPWTMRQPAQEILRATLRRHLQVAEDVFTELNYTGKRGIVYHLMGYEVPYVLDCLPHRDWWLLPWNYWGWDYCEKDKPAVVRREIDWTKAYFRELVAAGRNLCYLGNASLPTVLPETITELAAFCGEIGATGHLGMGNFVPQHGLRWHGATEEIVDRQYELYKRIFPATGR